MTLEAVPESKVPWIIGETPLKFVVPERLLGRWLRQDDKALSLAIEKGKKTSVQIPERSTGSPT